MVEEAVGPVVAELTACGRAVLMPVAGSALPGGHNPRVGFFLAAQLPASDEVALTPLAAPAEGAVMVEVEVEELVEARDEEEFCRCTVLRGPVLNILLTSLSFMAPKPLPLELQPRRVLGWKLRGGATAVICGVMLAVGEVSPTWTSSR